MSDAGIGGVGFDDSCSWALPPTHGTGGAANALVNLSGLHSSSKRWRG